ILPLLFDAPTVENEPKTSTRKRNPRFAFPSRFHISSPSSFDEKNLSTPRAMRYPNSAFSSAALVLSAAFLLMNSVAKPQTTPDADPYLWLEEIDSERSLAWVASQNTRSKARLETDPLFEELYQKTLDILNSEERIAYPHVRAERVYNFWQDAKNPRGIL